MTGHRAVTKLVATDGIGDLTFDQAMQRCVYRSVCGPNVATAGKRGIEAFIVLIGPPAPLHAKLLDRLQADVARGPWPNVCDRGRVRVHPKGGAESGRSDVVARRCPRRSSLTCRSCRRRERCRREQTRRPPRRASDVRAARTAPGSPCGRLFLARSKGNDLTCQSAEADP